MNATVTAPDLRLLAPVFAGRLALIIANLVALIARALLHDPKLAPLILPLYRRINRTTRGITALMASFAAGRTPRHRTGRSITRKSGDRAPKPRIPTTEAWLIHTLRHEAAGYASQLSHLLNEPGVPELLAATPTAGRLLRPLCRMLGLPATPPRAVAPDTPLRGVASPATGALPRQRQQRSRVARAGRPESVAASSRESAHPLPANSVSEATAAPPAPPARPPPPCPHVRWPWFQRVQTKPA